MTCKPTEHKFLPRHDSAPTINCGDGARVNAQPTGCYVKDICQHCGMSVERDAVGPLQGPTPETGNMKWTPLRGDGSIESFDYGARIEPHHYSAGGWVLSWSKASRYHRPSGLFSSVEAATTSAECTVAAGARL